MDDKKGSHVLLFDLNDSQPSSFLSVGRTSICSDQEDENKMKSDMDKWKADQVQVDDDQDEAYKWMPSKMRMLRKMMMSSCQESSHKLEDEKKFPLTTTNSSRRAAYNDESARVCADCNTTKTPLWRSGPRGPKSLCNACGIRQRKARRAMAAAAAASGTILGVTANPPPLKIRKLEHKKKKKKKRSRKKGVFSVEDKYGDDELIKKREKASSKKELVGLEDFTSRVLSKYYNAKVFPQDEKEAAILLMALSSPTNSSTHPEYASLIN